MKYQKRLLSWSVAVICGAALPAWAGQPAPDRPAVLRALNALSGQAMARAAAAASEHVSSDDAFEAVDLIVDADGTEHVRMARRYKGLRVIGGDAVVHGHPQAGHQGISRTWHRAAALDINPIRGAAEAMRAALAAFPHRQGKMGNKELVIWAREAQPRLAWDVTINGVQADGTPSQMHLIVNAGNGQILDRWDDVHTADVGVTGRTLYGGDVGVKASLSNGTYSLVDNGRGGHYVSDVNNGTDTNLLLFVIPASGKTSTSTTGVFGDGTTANRNSAAADAAFGFQTTWDYFAKVHGRNGIDNTGKKAYSRVHYGSNYNNAFWTDNCFCMTYGDGDGKVLKSLVALDVAGHEMSHGVTSTTARLTYSGESGGLNESTSDIFGSMVEFYAANSVDTGDYLIGEKIAGPSLGSPALRNMMNPSDDGKSADCWYSNMGSLDVHYSSGLGNHFYYLLAEGTSNGSPSRTCAAGDSRVATGKGSVQGIGRQKAEKIWYRALTVYMTSNTNYAGARQATLKAATDLYGASSNEVAAVAAAWTAVKVN
ncbi:MAG: M4 family metallopeptidase [Aquabacterium sp.]|nr:M4 family metallopeptidase [Aquabacterium sp.]